MYALSNPIDCSYLTKVSEGQKVSYQGEFRDKGLQFGGYKAKGPLLIGEGSQTKDLPAAASEVT
jgi:hypothetical protein